jgi:penicillin-binding protein 1A
MSDAAPQPPLPRPRLIKLRLLLVLVPLLGLAGVSTVFGMMMAVASDLPGLEAIPQVEKRRNSILLDARGRKLATLTSDEGRIIAEPDDIPPVVRNAVVAIEDERFYANSGVDVRGILRAAWQGASGGQRQGASTIAQQFVKVALRANDQRTLRNKVREAALAYHMTRKWSKGKILTEYLNAIYFGNGAYGVESAAQTYFGARHEGCGTARRRCVSELDPHEAATLAGIIQNPSRWDPVSNPRAAIARRNVVLRKMLDQGRLTRLEYDDAIRQPPPTRADVRPPQLRYEDRGVKGVPYFIAWVRQQLVERLGAREAFEGGLRITTTLDLDLQKAAETAVNRYLSWPQGPTASVVAIDNATGEVRAMVGGRDFQRRPFNLATQGQRQPGSSFKPFVLAEALKAGYGPGSVWPSRKRIFTVPGTRGREKFTVNNFDDTYTGQSTLANALTFSDNAVFAAAGIEVGTRKVATLARRMGIRTPVSTNLAMTLGGLAEGVTPLDMAHAYESFATRGLRVTGTLGAAKDGPVGIRLIERNEDPDGNGRYPDVRRNEPVRRRVLDKGVAETAVKLLQGPVRSGSGRRAAYGGFAAGKTGTTENSGDAWFVGFTDRLTIAVWVGYPDRLKPMLTEFGGQPVEGGTFPALIWHDIALAAQDLFARRGAKERAERGLPPEPEGGATGTTGPAAPAPVAPDPAQDVPDEGEGPVGGGAAPQRTPDPDPAPDPAPRPAPTPAAPTPPPAQQAPAPTPPAAGGDGGTGGTGGAVPPT